MSRPPRPPSARSTDADEQILLRTRTHAKALAWPALALIGVGAVVGAGAAAIPARYQPVGQYGVVGLGLVLVVGWTVLPFLRWWTTTYTITDRRLLTRTGILTKVGKDLPLNRINDVSSERSLTDRMFGCGTLEVATAAEDGTTALVDVPEVEHVHQVLTELLFSGPGATR